MTYSVKEIFLTLQGEGALSGKCAVFCRFSGCNLWDGLEAHRERAVCTFCDTDFVGTNGVNGGKFATANELAGKINDIWGDRASESKFVVLTGGEPLLQVDDQLLDELHNNGFLIAVETNGTIKAPEKIDWICVSPKANSQLNCISGDELKLVFPQETASPEQFEHLAFTHHFIQPMDNERQDEKIRAGASLVQFYSAMVYEGPSLPSRVCRTLAGLLKRDGFNSVADAVGADHR
ncbi:7-carboxy-7-deazaguanine synthase [Rhodospirillales bacterium]|nr:7-carboxy-7-deazaguanine synthase [Rhodospirillales bacterium]